MSQNSKKQEVVAEKKGILQTRQSNLRWTVQNLGGRREDIQLIQMLNVTDGWAAGSEGSLYKTTNGGESWTPVSIKAVPGASARSISFVTSSFGWVAYVKTPSEVLSYKEYESFIFNTRDAGITWDLQFSDKALEVNSIVFRNEQEGWAAGVRLSKGNVLESSGIVLHTQDHGKHWEDVSAGLNAASDHPSDAVTSIQAAGASQAIVLTSSSILRTQNAGASWKLLASPKDERPQTGLTNFGHLNDDRFWVIGGAYSIEGIWGLLTRKDADGSWVRYRTPGIYFKDAIFLSENEVFTCGSMIPAGLEFPTRGERDGAIFYSADGGQTWVIAHRTPRVQSVNALAAIDSRHVWAVGDGGSIFRLSSP